MSLTIQVASCNSQVVVTIQSIPGTYTFHLDGTDQVGTIPAEGTIATSVFTGPFTGGSTLNGYVEPQGVASCRESFSVDIPDCAPTIEYVCLITGAEYDITVSGCEPSITLAITAGPGTVVGDEIKGADVTTTFTVTDGLGCEVTGLTIGDGVNITPSGGDVQECTYFHDVSRTIEASHNANFVVTSLIVDGIEYVPGNVALVPKNIIAIGTTNYNTSLVDTLNSIGVPNMTFDYPTIAQLATADGLLVTIDVVLKGNILRIGFPDSSTFQITLLDKLANRTYIYNETEYIDNNVQVQYVLRTPVDCQTTNICGLP